MLSFSNFSFVYTPKPKYMQILKQNHICGIQEIDPRISDVLKKVSSTPP